MSSIIKVRAWKPVTSRFVGQSTVHSAVGPGFTPDPGHPIVTVHVSCLVWTGWLDWWSQLVLFGAKIFSPMKLTVL